MDSVTSGTIAAGQTLAGAAADFTGSITGNILTVSAVSSGTLAAGQTIYGQGVPGNTKILPFATTGTTGKGLKGNYVLSTSIPTLALTGSQGTTVLTVTALPDGTLAPGQTLSLPGSPVILSQATQTSASPGGPGTYNISGASQTVTSGPVTVTVPASPNNMSASIADGTTIVSGSGTSWQLNKVQPFEVPTTVFTSAATSAGQAQFNGSVTGTTLTVDSVTSGTLVPGQTLAGTSTIATGSVGTPFTASLGPSFATVFTGSITGATLTVANVTSGSIVAGQKIFAKGIPADTSILTFGTASTTGNGGIGTYALDISMPTSVTGYQLATVLTVVTTGGGPIVPGQQLSIAGTPTITIQLSSTEADGSLGKRGTYTVSNTQTVGSAGSPVSINFSVPASTTISGGVTYPLTVSGAQTNTFSASQRIYGRGLPTATTTTISSQFSAPDWGNGTYSVSATAPIFIGTITTTTLTVSYISSGTIALGQTISTISGTPLAGSPVITAFVTGTGGTGTYTISVSNTASSATMMTASVPSTTMVTKGDTLTVSALSSGSLGAGKAVYGSGLPAGVTISAQTSGTPTGGAGSYTLSAPPVIVTGSQAT
ncbi:MAG: hypothetical protein EBT09_10505, partial [Actinobacteria bacterium]|nr:hypothetical protein [Actinomycetota bacterium]